MCIDSREGQACCGIQRLARGHLVRTVNAHFVLLKQGMVSGTFFFAKEPAVINHLCTGQGRETVLFALVIVAFADFIMAEKR